MSKLIYIYNTSLDGYVEDENGSYDWGNPDRVFDVITELLRPVGTHLLGRRMSETMAHWNAPVDEYPPGQREFARVWQQAEDLVFSRAARTFDPQTIAKLKRESKHDITIGGAELAAQALRAGLVDECHLFTNPVVLGAGKPVFPTGLRLDLELLETQRFHTGVVHLRYRVRNRPR